ncbi:tRNA pseudouridine(38-40) synthase TruA [Pelosinus baikalensis]|uniref:tRNA pseudouridine synthase A n=1 Tax=Pelosinus baikalensis TaxID=2892015 RepID=A0ABS8HWW8_9FIRM|nr:tRNA pseudouridine(38-40) synthase TruA [Pelosinus baikalensis]MCC5467081.1 tRNA pseudouridine(38-40) synthase TruA [Pelosinus baikalensis]
MRNIKLTLAYDGTAYHGFQRQINAIGIQQVLEDKLARIVGHTFRIHMAGRTDSGVHAYGQVVNFKTTSRIPVDRIAIASRSLLPYDIVVLDAQEVPDSFDAQYSAQSKIYVYKIYQHTVPNPFLRNLVWTIPQTLNVPAMKEAAQTIIGTHDFSAFRASGGASVSPIRTIMAVECQLQDRILELSFWGNGFLYHMVRNLTGTLVNVGLGKTSLEKFKTIFEGRDRKKAGATAPAHGLYLKEVRY